MDAPSPTRPNGTAGSELLVRLTVLGLGALVTGVVLAGFSRDGRDRSWMGVGVGSLPRTGVPWVVAAFVIGAIAGWCLRAWPLRLAVAAGAVAATAALTIANGTYYRVDRWNDLLQPGTSPRFWTIVGVVVGIVFGAAGTLAVRRRTDWVGGTAIGALAVTIAAEPFLWHQLGSTSRSLSPTGTWTSVAVGAALPLLLLPGRHRLVALAVVPGVAMLAAAAPMAAAVADHLFSMHT